MINRLPPNNTELEAGLLGSFLLGDPEAIAEIVAAHRNLEDYFYDLRHRNIYVAVRDLSGAGKAIDVLTVQGQLKQAGKLEDAGGLGYLSSLPDQTPSAANAAYYADALRELYLKRRALKASAILQEIAYSNTPASALLEVLEREMNGIAFENAPAEVSMKQHVQESIIQMEDAFNNRGKLRGVGTGFGELDRTTHGLRSGQLVVIGASTGVGKTAFALNIAAHVVLEERKPVGFIQLEMTGSELTSRLIALRSGVQMDRILSGDLAELDLELIASASGQIAKAPLHIADEWGITIAQLRAKARRLHRRHKLALLVVDYIQQVLASQPNASRTVEVSQISNSLKALAKELGIPVIALSQLNRNAGSEGRAPQLRDLRDSGSIEQDADIVILMHRPDTDRPEVNINIAKHRQGPCRKLELAFDGATFRFRPAIHDGFVPAV